MEPNGKPQLARIDAPAIVLLSERNQVSAKGGRWQ